MTEWIERAPKVYDFGVILLNFSFRTNYNDYNEEVHNKGVKCKKAEPQFLI